MSTEAVPTCYRHPGRETYVRCTRCDRPICPDCMRDASVGHQCPECVSEGQKSTRQARTVLGGRVTSGKPVVTYSLIGICVLMYLAEVISERVVAELMMVGLRWTPEGLVGVADGEWYRLVTAMFLHQPPTQGTFGITHILFNMLILWMIGPALEQALGRWRFLTLYMLAGLGGSVLVYLLAPLSGAVGASGAVFGLFGAFLVIGRRLGRPTGQIVVLVAINLVLSFTVPGISWEGHVGGLIVGTALAAAYAYAPSPRRDLVHVTASVVMLGLLVALVLAKTAAL